MSDEFKTRILHLSEFPPHFTAADLVATCPIKQFRIKWLNDQAALLVFSSPNQGIPVLALRK